MRRQLRLFRRLLALNIAITWVYRGEFAIMQLGTLVTPLVSLLVWRAALTAGAELAVGAEYLTSYFLLVSVVTMLTSSWTSFFLAESIRDGSLNRWLVRPASTHLDAAANNLGEKLVKLVLIVPLVAVAGWLLRDSWSVPEDPRRWALFVLSLVLAAVLRLTLDVLVGSLAFWFADVQGFIRAVAVLVPLLSGAVVPLALVPPMWRVATEVQPFRFMVSFPMEVLLGQPGALLAGFGWQLAWVLTLLALAVGVWRRGLRSYSAAGV